MKKYGYELVESPIEIMKQYPEEYTCVACSICNTLRLEGIYVDKNDKEIIDTMLRNTEGKTKSDIDIERVQQGISFTYNIGKNLYYKDKKIVFKNERYNSRIFNKKRCIALVHSGILRELMFNRKMDYDLIHAVVIWKIEKDYVYIIDSSPYIGNGVIKISLRNFKKCIMKKFYITVE